MTAESQVEIVREVLRAMEERRVHDVSAYTTRDIEWLPVSRPAEPVYTGDEGTWRLIDDVHRVRPGYTLRYEITQTGPSTVVAKICMEYVGRDGETVETWFQSTFTFDGDKICRGESTALDPP